MARVKLRNGEIMPQTIGDLKRGDKVCITFWGGRYVTTTVTRVRIVECATIISVKKVTDCNCTRFVRYKSSRIATAEERVILTLDRYFGDMIDECLKSAEERSEVIVTRAKALKAMMLLKDWLFTKENDYKDRDPE